jgi:dolichol kinase
MTGAEFSRAETLRRIVHVGVGALAYLTPVLGYPVMLGLTATAVVANTFVLPHLPGLRVVREVPRGDRGVRLYPVAVLVLLLVFRSEPWIAQAGWLTLGFGDGATPWFARLVRGGPAWPTRPTKRILPSMLGAVLATAAVWPVVPLLDGARWAVAAAAGFAGALADALPERFEDNVAWAFFGAGGAALAAGALA